MSQYVKINASEEAKRVNGGTGNVHGGGPASVPRAAGNGRPVERSTCPLQRTRRLAPAARPGAPTTTMTSASAGQSNPSAGPTGRKVVNFYLTKGDASPQLQTCKNAWVPSCLKTKQQDTENTSPSSDEDVQIEETRKKFLSILNKVSPENMHLLTDQVMALPIETEQCLRAAIELLFQKAISEPHFTPQYAHVCTEMHRKDNKRNGDAKSRLSFKKILTMCCQDRLSEMRAHDVALAKILQDLDACNDQDVKEQMQSTYDQDETDYRKKSVGNCRFMCELYKVEMLTRHTLEMSLKHLLKSPKEETLECACNILNHTGSTISHKASFNKLSEYTSPDYKSVIPTRIRFMMQDTIELKENNWVPRNSRPKEPTCNTRASPYTKKPVLHNIPLAQTVSTQKKKELTVETRKASGGQNNQLATATKIEDPRQPSLSGSANDDVKSYASLLSRCAGRVTEATNSGQSSDDEIQKKCQAMIDNICPDNMVPTAQSMLALPIKTDACLKGVVDIVFQKAMNVPESAPRYAHICSVMQHVGVRSEEQENTNTTFRILLIAKCQNAFESMYTRKVSVTKDRINIESCKDKETRRQLQLKFDENELDYRRRSVANCRFICELLKVNVLTPPILEMCLEKLVETLKETSMECLYVIVKHTRNEINHSDIFEKLYEYLTAGKQKLSSRVRTVIQDTLELKDSV